MVTDSKAAPITVTGSWTFQCLPFLITVSSDRTRAIEFYFMGLKWRNFGAHAFLRIRHTAYRSVSTTFRKLTALCISHIALQPLWTALLNIIRQFNPPRVVKEKEYGAAQSLVVLNYVAYIECSIHGTANPAGELCGYRSQGTGVVSNPSLPRMPYRISTLRGFSIRRHIVSVPRVARSAIRCTKKPVQAIR